MYTEYRLEVCDDCLYLLANGEVFDEHGNDISTEHSDRMYAVWGSKVLHMVPACEEDSHCDSSFSWNDCGGCGSTLGGRRHPAVVLAP